MNAGRERLEPGNDVLRDIVEVAVAASCKVFKPEVADVERRVLIAYEMVDSIGVERIEREEGQGALVELVVGVAGEKRRQAAVLDDEHDDKPSALELN